jgi:hypothetical protein
MDYAKSSLLGTSSRAVAGLRTSDNNRFLRCIWEVAIAQTWIRKTSQGPAVPPPEVSLFVPYLKGARGRRWIEPVQDVCRWFAEGIEYLVTFERKYAGFTTIQNRRFYFRRGVAFTPLGAEFSGRLILNQAVIGDMGLSVYPANCENVVALMNSKTANHILVSLNPTVHFQPGDVDRLPLLTIANADEILNQLEAAFSIHGSHREPAVEFNCPGPSPWRYAQEWAQTAVDRPDGVPLPPYEPEYDPEPPTDYLSYALGVALGRFGPNGEGILDPSRVDLSHALPAGILFLDGSLGINDHRDCLGLKAAKPLLSAWSDHGRTIDAKCDLRDYLRTGFFEGVHRKMYENRPIHWPLSSEKKTFVAWVTIHRWDERTLRVLLADHLGESLKRLDGEIDDLRAVRDGADKKAAREAEKRYAKVQKWREELVAFIAAVEQCAEQGPPPTDAACPPRETNAR